MSITHPDIFNHQSRIKRIISSVDEKLFAVKEDQPAFTAIHLEDFQGFDDELILDFLLINGHRNFEVVIPRDWENNHELRRAQFLAAAYAGEMLSSTSEKFAYLVPAEESFDPFRFYLCGVNHSDVAMELSFLTEAYFETGNSNSTEVFNIRALEFMDRCYADASEVKTWGLLELANR